MRCIASLILVCGLVATASALAATPPTLDDLLRAPEYDDAMLSPQGSFLAAKVRTREPEGERALLAIFDRETRKPLRLLDPGAHADVARAWWTTDRRLFLTTAWGDHFVHQYALDPDMVAIDADGGRKRAFLATMIDPLIDDDAHILIQRCGAWTSSGCRSYAQLADNDGVPTGARLVDAPDVDVQFFSDNAGRVLFAYAWGDDDRQKLWFRDGGQWRTINDEAVSGVEVLPIGVSRDGRSAYLRSQRVDGPDAIERFDLTDGRREVVLQDAHRDPLEILWSADGRQPIGALYGDEAPRARFWVADDDPDAVALRALETAFPGRTVRFVSGTRDGRRAVVSIRGDREPGAFYLYDRDSRRAELIARTRPWLSPDALAPTHAIAFAARDGTSLDGYLTLPLATGDALPPLVVLPHGGPLGVRDDAAFDEEVQLLATHGYAVLRVNFRGSAGRGRRFEQAGRREWGGRILDDIADGVRWTIAQGQVDPARICIWGTSFGGYAALQGTIREPGLYRCAISTSGPTDLRLLRRWGETHRIRYGRRYLDDAVGRGNDALAAQSPLRNVAQMQADVLLVHGEHDTRVPFEHARRLQRAMVRAGKPPQTLFLQQEGHGIFGEDNRRLYYATVLDFLAAHLGMSGDEADHDPAAARALACARASNDLPDVRHRTKRTTPAVVCPMHIPTEVVSP